jgi:hypothetical protein
LLAQESFSIADPDRLHRSKNQNFDDGPERKSQPHILPPYAPDRNPGELAWSRPLARHR